MINKLQLEVQGTDELVDLDIKYIYNAGYAGSDQMKVKEHINDLVKMGVQSPRNTPTVYPISNYLITDSNKIQVQHRETSGEIEYVLIWVDNELFVTVGSDHTDRRLETNSIPAAKQVCPNVIASEVWRFKDVKDHWNKLELKCYITKNEKRLIYQNGTCADLLTPGQWKPNFEKLNINQDGNAFFSGTINTLTDSLTVAESYDLQLYDPILNRKITKHYKIECLSQPIE